MKTFIFERVENLTNSYHTFGGAVVITETLERAGEILPEIKNLKPDYEYEGGIEEKIFIFPDAGCC